MLISAAIRCRHRPLGTGYGEQLRCIKCVQQRLRLLEIGRVETFGEPAVDWCEEVAGFGVAALVAAEPGEARGGAQFPELGLLLLRDAQGFVIQLLDGLEIPLPQQQPAFVPVQLRCEPALPRPFNDLQCIVQQGQGLFHDNVLNDNTRIEGVFQALKAKFKVAGARNMLATVNSIYDFRNTRVAHQEKDITDPKEAQQNLVGWINGLTALAEAP